MTATDFESDVRALLQLQGWFVTGEKILGHKKIDAYAERTDSLGALQRVAIECKEWERSLSQRDVSNIFANYYPLIERNLIDTILIVTSRGISPSAMTYVEDTRNLRHLTHAQLLNALIDFRAHIQAMISSYTCEAVSKYYVAQDYVEGKGSIEQYLLEWVNSEDSQPIAVLGGYGFGKTTLAKRLGYILGLRCNRDHSARIPVLIPLAHIATDQTLEGLLGRQFTSATSCPNYNFQLFMSLNMRGRFVFFLDGFDEMKKTMSWDALVFNLTQLNQLVTPKSKVVLLGRPSAFLSSDEQEEALHGRVRHLGATRRVPGWPDYRELHLSPFTREQVTTFVRKYLRTLSANNHASVDKSHRVGSYVSSIESEHGERLLDLASRPVQLWMLMDLLPEYTGSLDKLTVAILYSEFIDLLLRREASKTSRSAFTKEQRLRFIAKLAYWMWQDGQRSDFDLRRLPEFLFEEHQKALQEVHSLDVKRDLVSGGFLDRKPPNIFYFPHRSFQEFLVAEEIRHMTYGRDPRINDCGYLTPEATSFVVELLGKRGIKLLRDWWMDSLRISNNLDSLIRTGCAYYGVEWRVSSAAPEPKSPTREEREALLTKLNIAGVVSSPEREKKQLKEKRPKPLPSQKPKYYRRH